MERGGPSGVRGTAHSTQHTYVHGNITQALSHPYLLTGQHVRTILRQSPIGFMQYSITLLLLISCARKRHFRVHTTDVQPHPCASSSPLQFLTVPDNALYGWWVRRVLYSILQLFLRDNTEAIILHMTGQQLLDRSRYAPVIICSSVVHYSRQRSLLLLSAARTQGIVSPSLDQHTCDAPMKSAHQSPCT